MRGFLVGLLALTGLQAVVSKGGSGRVGEGFTLLATIINHAVSPAYPAIPDLRYSAANGDWNSSSTPGTGAWDVTPSGLTTTRPTAPTAPATRPTYSFEPALPAAGLAT